MAETNEILNAIHQNGELYGIQEFTLNFGSKKLYEIWSKGLVGGDSRDIWLTDKGLKTIGVTQNVV